MPIVIGVCGEDDAARLEGEPAEVVVVPPQLTRPARLNRLFASTAADIVILLEAACVPVASAISRLVDALQKPEVGLAGPSTNRAWNEQRVDGGQDAAARFGDECRTLEPLYSLSDFCYAVRREVFDSIGPADEGYGAGPCWEMDYNIRAARAGFAGVWVCGAFVWRAAQTAEEEAAELALFEASRRRYQDRFCGARLRGVKHDYRGHCRGDDCPNFAPDPAPMGGPPALPLVSCVMATCDRRPFIPLALAGYGAQTYPNRELIVVDDGHDPIEDLIPATPDIRYVRVPPRASLGVKRNLGIGEARGRIVILWDDDDWYAATRIERQVAPLLSGEADITGLLNRFLLQLPERKCWTVTAELHEMMYACDLPGGTMAFPRSLWQGGLRFPDYSLAEDAAFLREAVKMGKKVVRIDEGPQFIYVRHGANTWSFQTGNFLHASGWREAERPESFPAESLEAYAAAAAAHRTRAAGG